MVLGFGSGAWGGFHTLRVESWRGSDCMEDHSLGLYTLNPKTGTSGPRFTNWSEVTTIRG